MFSLFITFVSRLVSEAWPLRGGGWAGQKALLRKGMTGREGFVTPSGSTKVAQEELPLWEEGRRSGPTSGPAPSSLNLWNYGLAAPVTAGRAFPSHWGQSLWKTLVDRLRHTLTGSNPALPLANVCVDTCTQHEGCRMKQLINDLADLGCKVLLSGGTEGCWNDA